MRIIALKPLKDVSIKHPEIETSLKLWIVKVKKAKWNKSSDIFETFTKARTIKGDRVVFNINKNDFRLVVLVNYESQKVFIKFIGTHSEYDKIDSETINLY
jgi:mRNA interferase HigB